MKDSPAPNPEWTHNADNVTPIDVTPPLSSIKGGAGTMAIELHTEPSMSDNSPPPQAAQVQIIQHRNPLASALAMSALLASLVAAGGGYYLWQKLSDVQQLAGRTAGVNQGQLDETKNVLQQQAAAKIDATAADLKAQIAQSQADTSVQLAQIKSELGSELEAKTSAIDARLNEQVTRLDQSVAAVQSNAERAVAAVTQQPEQLQSSVATIKAELQAELAKAAQADAAQVSALQSEVSNLRGAYGELRDSVTARIESAEGAQAALKQTVSESTLAITQAVNDAQARLQQATQRSETQWTLNEVEQILMIGERQVALERNPTRAVTAFRTADQRLQSLTDPKVATLRDAVRADLAALEQVAPPAIDEVIKALARLETQSLQLPSGPRIAASEKSANNASALLSNVESPAPESKPLQAVRGLAEATWDAVRGQVVSRQDGKVVPVTLTADQAFVVHQNLRLKLESARLAALRADNVTFHASLSDAAQWVGDFFRPDANETRQFLDGVKQLTMINLNVPTPDVSGSLKALREVKANFP